MADVPVVIPLLILGVLIGLVLRGKARMGWRLATLGSLFGGLGNLAYGGALTLFQSRTAVESVSRPIAIRQATSIDSPPVFLAFCFLAGFLMVLLVFASAALTLRIRRERALEG